MLNKDGDLTHKRDFFIEFFWYLLKVTKTVKWSDQLSGCK